MTTQRKISCTFSNMSTNKVCATLRWNLSVLLQCATTLTSKVGENLFYIEGVGSGIMI